MADDNTVTQIIPKEGYGRNYAMRDGAIWVTDETGEKWIKVKELTHTDMVVMGWIFDRWFGDDRNED